MHVIAKKCFTEAAEKYPNQRTALMDIYRVLTKTNFRSPDEMVGY